MTATGCEVDVTSSVSHCGACGNACSAANAVSSCGGGACAFACKSGFGDCDQNKATGCEVDVTSSVSHCGACGNACAAGWTCVLGACKPPDTLALAAGLYHTCALLSDGTVKCWGINGQGQLGLGDTANRGDAANELGDKLPAVALGMGKTAKALAAGPGHTCAVLSDDTVKCWGYNFSGQLGLGDTADRGDAANELGDSLPAVALGAGKSAKALAAGLFHTCALLSAGTVKCWGSNFSGQLGLGDTANRVNANELGDNLPAVLLFGP